MITASRPEQQISIVLEAMQAKRRMERILEAATALLDRYAAQTAVEDRLELWYQLIRRNFSPEVAVSFGGRTFGPEPAPRDDLDPEAVFTAVLTGADGTTGTITAHYTAPGALELTVEQWRMALRLLVGVLGLGIGGGVVCQR